MYNSFWSAGLLLTVAWCGSVSSEQLVWHATAVPSRTYPFSSDQGSQTGLGSISTRLSDRPGTLSAVVSLVFKLACCVCIVCSVSCFMLACCICTLCSPQKTDCLPKSECCPTQLNTWVPTYASWLPLYAYTASDWLSCMGTYTPCTPGWTQSKGTCSNLPTGACCSPL